MTKDEQIDAITKLPAIAGMVDGYGDFFLMLSNGKPIYFTGITDVTIDATGSLWVHIELYNTKSGKDGEFDENEYFGFSDGEGGVVPIQASHIIAIVDRANVKTDADTDPRGPILRTH